MSSSTGEPVQLRPGSPYADRDPTTAGPPGARADQAPQQQAATAAAERRTSPTWGDAGARATDRRPPGAWLPVDTFPLTSSGAPLTVG